MMKKGFTLIELLIYFGLVAAILTAMVLITLDIILGNVKSSVEQEVLENIRYASYRIQFEIRNADSIDGSSSSFGINLATDSNKKVSFSAPAPYDPLEFRVKEGGKLQIRSLGEIEEGEEDDDLEWKSLTSSSVEVTNLTFTNLSDGSSESIRFVLIIKYKNPTGVSQWEKEITFEGGAQLRCQNCN